MLRNVRKWLTYGISGTAVYGTAATTIEGFYAALHSGDGKLAATFVVPEKTRKGPFRPQALPRYCGSLSTSITLLDVHGVDDNLFSVRYRFLNGKQICDGFAIVTTANRSGRDFMQAI